MSLFTLFEAIVAQIATIKDSNNVQKYKTIGVWNDQVKALQDKGDESVIDSPACFIEYENVIPEQLGNGFQIFNPLRVILHIVHYQLDTGSGTMDENKDIYLLADEIFKKMQMFKPSGAGSFIRTSEKPDYNHNNIYHWIQEYTTNYIDSGAQPPTGAILSPAPLDLETTIDNTP